MVLSGRLAVSMSGTIVASSGNLGGFIIDSSEVRSSNNNLRSNNRFRSTDIRW